VTGRARIGCSGWDYPDWRGVVYPTDLPRKLWFASYAERFDTVELNATFYRLPAAETVGRWAAQAPPGFVYAVKVGQFGTHRMKLRDPGPWLANHLERSQRLGDHEGPNLAQLPPRWRRDTARLAAFLSAARAAAPSRRWAVELRDPSWVHDDVLSTLADHGAALCIHDLLERHPWERTTDWTYLRFHGPDATRRPYRGGYTPQRLGAVARRLRDWLDDGTDVYAYFNNDFDGHAVTDATRLRQLVDR
jgi:uncharacterized protein YecE (DUF72 family)